MIQDSFNLALKNLRKRRLRSWLTMVGIIISVAIIFILISLSIGLQNAVTEQFEILGGDKFFIQPKGQLGPPQAGASVQLTKDDLKIVERTSGVKEATYITIGNGEIEFNKEKRFFIVAGIPPDGMKLYTSSGSLEVEEGKNIGKGDIGKIVIGNHYKTKNIFSKPVKAGDKFLINGKEFEVQGIFALIGNPDDDRNIIMLSDDFEELFGSGDRVDTIVVQINDGENINDIANSVERKLQRFRNVDDKTQDFTILTPEELLATFQTVLSVITLFLFGVAAISLIVGAINITNTMYTSVLERYKEIGIMKAIGAQNKDILSIFLIESGLLGLVGGVMGVIFGFGVSKLIEYIAVQQLGTKLLQAAAPLYLIIGCLAFAFLTGAISGLWPAWNASKVSAVDAIRYE
ncbi:ABC transporter permease [Candidatus Pacearchaeota archaeon]|nr:ABC transporter permease [Candidatus Pacearchaeota archaeon]